MSRGGAGAAVRETVTGPFLVEMCVLHSRMTVGTARSSAKCTSRRRGAPAMVAAHPAAPLPGARGGAGCPNLLQRPRSRRSTERETLIFRAFLRGRSRPGAPLQQIRSRPRPGSPQEPQPHHHTPAHPHHRTDPGPRTVAPDEKGSFPRPDQTRIFAYDPCVPRLSCVSSHLRPGGSAEPSVDEELCRGTRDRPRSRR